MAGDKVAPRWKMAVSATVTGRRYQVGQNNTYREWILLGLPQEHWVQLLDGSFVLRQGI